MITLSEAVIGTVASLGTVIESQGWSLDAVMVADARVERPRIMLPVADEYRAVVAR